MRNMSKIFRTRPNGTAQNGIGWKKCDPCTAEETELSITPAKSCSLMQDPRLLVRSFQSALNASCSYLQVLGSPTVLGSS